MKFTFCFRVRRWYGGIMEWQITLDKPSLSDAIDAACQSYYDVCEIIFDKLLVARNEGE